MSKNKLTPVRLANLLGVPVLVGKALCKARGRPLGNAGCSYVRTSGALPETYLLNRKTLTVDGKKLTLTVRWVIGTGGALELVVRDYVSDTIISIIRFSSKVEWEAFRDTVLRNRD